MPYSAYTLSQFGSAGSPGGGGVPGDGQVLYWDTTTNKALGSLNFVFNASLKQLTIKAASSQTANLQEWQNSSGTPLSVINKDGWTGVGATSPLSKLHIFGGSSNDYITSDAGLNFRQVIAPSASITATLVASAGNVDVGDHRYFTTFVTALGETNVQGGIWSNTVTCDAGHRQVDLTGIPTSTDYRVTSRKVYRTPVSSPLYYGKLLVTLNDNITTTYTDNVADANLGDTGPYPGAYYYRNDTNSFIRVNGNRAMAFDTQLTMFGVLAGYSLTTGYGNQLFGYQCGYNLTTGFSNTFAGYSSGSGITTGDGNVAYGFYSLGGAGTAAGNNIAVGYYAGQGTTGGGNVFIGNYAGSMFIGGQTAGVNASVAIGNYAYTVGSNQFVLGYPSYITTGGIGTANPSALWHVKGQLVGGTVFIAQGAAAQAGNLTEWQNSSGTLLAYVDASGLINGVLDGGAP